MRVCVCAAGSTNLTAFRSPPLQQQPAVAASAPPRPPPPPATVQAVPVPPQYGAAMPPPGYVPGPPPYGGPPHAAPPAGYGGGPRPPPPPQYGYGAPVGPAAGPSTAAAAAPGPTGRAPVPRMIAGKVWTDASLADWPDNDFRIFVGDLGNETNDDALAAAFAAYPSLARAKVVRDKRTGKTKGYGFVSFLEAVDGARALKEMDGAYIGNRPVKLRRSTWAERTPAGIAKKGRLPPKRMLKKHSILPQPE